MRWLRRLGLLALVLAVVAVSVVAWASNSTHTSQTARVLMWLDSEVTRLRVPGSGPIRAQRSVHSQTQRSAHAAPCSYTNGKQVLPVQPPARCWRSVLGSIRWASREFTCSTRALWPGRLGGTPKGRDPVRSRPGGGGVDDAGRLPGPALSVLEMQRLAGNRAIASLVGEREAGRGHDPSEVRRYISGEHAMVGARKGEEETTLEVNGVRMTYGEWTALADHFKDPAQLRQASRKELRTLVTLVRRERDHLQGKPGATAVKESEWEKATGGRYTELAAKNVEHYAGADGGAGHRETWRRYHVQALRLAQQGNMDQAMKVNAFGDHFLTDAFAAGHLVSRIGPINTAKARMKDFKPGARGFALRVSRIVFANPDAVGKLSGYDVKPKPAFGGWVPASEKSFADLMALIARFKKPFFYGAFLKAVHDRLNRDIKRPGGGLWVRNAKGTKWKLPGDESLLKSGQTLAIIREAVAQSRENLADVRGKSDVDHGPLIKKVEDYIPVLTAQGANQVSEAMRVVNPRLPVASQAYAQVIIETLDVIIEKLVEVGRLKDVTGTPPRHGPPGPRDAGPG